MKETVLHSIFLDLFNAYNALGRDRCLYILTGYVVGTRILRILQTYWARLQMLAKSGGHYRLVFQIHHGVTQGDLLSPTMFNVIFYTVIQH